MLDVKKDDYVWVRKAMIHRWHLGATPFRAMVFEAPVACACRRTSAIPWAAADGRAVHHRDFVRPTGPIATVDHVPDGPRELFVKRAGKFQRYALERSPMDVVGGTGSSIRSRSRSRSTSEDRAHSPAPTIHDDVRRPGYLVCSFVPRVTDTHPQAIRPYPHSRSTATK